MTTLPEVREDGVLLDILGRTNKAVTVDEYILQQATLDHIYRFNKIIQKIVTLKPEDATKSLPQWNLAESQGDAERLRQDYLRIEAIGQPLEELSVQTAITKACIYGNHYGEGLIFLGINDGLDPSQPVNLAKIKSIDWLVVKHRFEVGLNYQRDGYTVYFDPQVNVPDNSTFYHKSRVLRIPGVKLHGQMLYDNGGFNDSIIQAVYRCYLNYNKTVKSGSDMLQSHSLFKYKLNGFKSLVLKKKRRDLTNRFESIISGLASLGGLIFDADTEDAEFITRTYGGVDGLIKQVESWFLAIADMPRGKLFGNAATTSLSEAGESEKDQWNEYINRYQCSHLLPIHTKLTNYLLAAQGNPDANFTINYPSHYPLSEKQMAEIKKINSETDKNYKEMEVLDADTIRDSRFGGSEYGLEIIL